MIVNVEACWPGHGVTSFRLRWTYRGIPACERVSGERWTRKVATEALDLLEQVYKLPRRSIRFRHH